MKTKRGFTLIEVVVVLTVGAILLGISVVAFGQVRSGMAVREGTRIFASFHARARAQAVEFGQTVEFHVDVDGDSIWVERNDTVLERANLMTELGVDMRSSSSTYRLCMNSRGYGQTSCNSFSSLVIVGFMNGADTATVRMLPLGGISY